MKTTLFRRLTCVVLALVMVLSLSVGVFAYTCSNWATQELADAQEKGLIPTQLQEVDMTKSLTRQEMCSVIVHTFEEMTGVSLYPASTSHFNDTKDEDVCIAAELGIVNGYTDGSFRPGNTITRQEYAKVVHGFYTALGWHYGGQTLESFSDADLVSKWAQEPAALIVELGLAQGSGGKLNPLGNSSRQETLVLMLRLYEYLDAYFALEPEPPEPPETPDAAMTAEPGETPAQPLETICSLPLADPDRYFCSNWAKEEMAKLAEYGLLPESLQEADLTPAINRQEICYAAVLLYEKLSGKTATPAATNHFTDTQDPVINAAYELNIISGFPNKTFGPEQTMTREQLFKIMTNLMTALEWTEPTPEDTLHQVYQDADQIAKWARESAALMAELTIMKGDTKGNMNPTANTTREQGIVMFLRAFDYIAPWYAEHPLGQITGPLTAGSKAEAVVKLALTYVGYPYVYGGASPSTGFDCSGFTSYIYKQFGYNIGRTTDAQLKAGVEVPKDQMQPGDIIVMSTAATAPGHGHPNPVSGHVGIYIGDNKMVHAESSRTGVVITYDFLGSNYNARFMSARRIIN